MISKPDSPSMMTIPLAAACPVSAGTARIGVALTEVFVALVGPLTITAEDPVRVRETPWTVLCRARESGARAIDAAAKAAREGRDMAIGRVTGR